VINNVLTTTAQTRHSINPANRQPNPKVPVSTQEDLDRAVDCAEKAFQQWSKVSVEERGAALVAFSDVLEDYTDDFARLLTREQGKALALSYREIADAVEWLRSFPSLQLPEEVIKETDEVQVIQRYVPIGVTCGIVPWNSPILLACGKIGPALYTGNVIIIKPSPYTPYCDLKLGELGTQIFPPGVLQVLSGDDSLGPMMTAHPGIGCVSFTGSILTGKKVMASCAPTLKRITLELGGNDAAIVCDDVDIDAVVPKVSGTSSYLIPGRIFKTHGVIDRNPLFPMFVSDLHEYQASVRP
jgi:acyl-CoA reductase-like NAD-dependent aldehyde dehydrogenase